MTPKRLLDTVIAPALYLLGMDSRAARVMLLAIAYQESRIEHRRQVSADGTESGPAVSFWQFEKGGGCKGVLTHGAAKGRMQAACQSHGVQPTAAALWEAMKTNDVLGATAARLLLYTLPDALPVTEAEGWKQYIEAWRPGKPHAKTWPTAWSVANATVPL